MKKFDAPFFITDWKPIPRAKFTPIVPVEKLILFPNGVVGAFDPEGQQMAHIQQTGWLELYLDYLESKGQDPTAMWIEAQLYGGVWKRIMPFKTTSGSWNWTFGESSIK